MKTDRLHSVETKVIFACISIGAALTGLPCSSRSQTPGEDIAAQVRSQGYRCDRPISARRDAKRSRRDSAVWVLKCANATYRVRLDPDMAARVTKL
jgi:hypothetical protein